MVRVAALTLKLCSSPSRLLASILPPSPYCLISQVTDRLDYCLCIDRETGRSITSFRMSTISTIPVEP